MDKDDKTLMWSVIVSIVMMLNCLGMQEYLRIADQELCKPAPISESSSSSGGYSFEVNHYNHSTLVNDLFFSEVIPCSPSGTRFFYRLLGVAAVIFFGLAILLPCIIIARRRAVEKTKLFAAD